MANFYLIDQSFREEGSHHADYLHCVGLAAYEMGFNVVIGANRGLPNKWTKGCGELKRFATIKPIFQRTTYQQYSGLAGMQRMKRQVAKVDCKPERTSRFRRMVERLTDYREERQRESIVRQFARDCAIFFRDVSFSRNDHVFFASISDLELVGMARYLSRTPSSIQAQWHAQFHFNLLDGRPPDYERQGAVLQSVRARLTSALAPIVYHNLNLYTTTEELADQFNQLGVGYFQPLVYPIAKEFAPESSRAFVPKFAANYANRAHVGKSGREVHSEFKFRLGKSSEPAIELCPDLHDETGKDFSESAASKQPSVDQCDLPSFATGLSEMTELNNCQFDETLNLKTIGAMPEPKKRPLRVVCPGVVRREKGQADYFQPLINQVFDKLSIDRQIQLIAQVPARKLGEREKLVVEVPKGSTQILGVEPVLTIPHPLPREEYCDLIRNTDIGLLFYDSQIYYGRRAGILGELLSAGKPVVVPAGCWLAEQIAEPIFQHADLHFASRDHQIAELADVNWESSNAPMHGGVINFDDQRRPFRVETEVVEGDSSIGIRFDWHWPLERGIYCRIELEQLHDERILKKSCQVVGHRRGRSRHSTIRKPIAMFPLDLAVNKIRITLKNAFHHSSASLRNFQVLIAKSSNLDSKNATFPLGAVGVIAPDRDHLGESLSEAVTYFEHYHRSAMEFSHQWYAKHTPHRTITQLIASDSLAADVA